uniref:Serine/threonine-protein kinase ULK4 n=1 Tax=Tetraselmis sp. GSL018 TaxID=582737 RepID=A0A061R4M6_9CHLO|mmetsp:Transcript_38950/g.92240  ORF Transcript_38950/g.92240 Transcript_38950/m.92240 type:complete len:550 (-) Transcript_38950:262-1911(-)
MGVRKGRKDGSSITKGGAWTSEEDELLANMQKKMGNQWSAIAQHIPGRTGQQCAQRWRHKVNPNIRKDKWTLEEDRLLESLVKQFGTRWAEIARRCNGRTDQQCMGRWRRHLDPSIKRESWSAAEDAALVRLHGQHGAQWSFISKTIPGRTAQQCRARFFQIQGSEASVEALSGSQPTASCDTDEPPSAGGQRPWEPGSPPGDRGRPSVGHWPCCASSEERLSPARGQQELAPCTAGLTTASVDEMVSLHTPGDSDWTTPTKGLLPRFSQDAAACQAASFAGVPGVSPEQITAALLVSPLGPHWCSPLALPSMLAMSPVQDGHHWRLSPHMPFSPEGSMPHLLSATPSLLTPPAAQQVGSAQRLRAEGSSLREVPPWMSDARCSPRPQPSGELRGTLSKDPVKRKLALVPNETDLRDGSPRAAAGEETESPSSHPAKRLRREAEADQTPACNNRNGDGFGAVPCTTPAQSRTEAHAGRPSLTPLSLATNLPPPSGSGAPNCPVRLSFSGCDSENFLAASSQKPLLQRVSEGVAGSRSRLDQLLMASEGL